MNGATGMTFRATLWRYPGPGGWTFVTLPAEWALPVTGAFGRTPVQARVEGGVPWPTSVWQDKVHGTILAIPKRARGAKDHGDELEVEITLDLRRA